MTTPLPWSVAADGVHILDANGLVVASTRYNPPGRENSTEQMADNAAMIVAAVNALDGYRAMAEATHGLITAILEGVRR